MIMTNTTNNNLTKFETGKKYFCRSICDSDCVFEFEVVKRTEKTVTIKDFMGETKRRKITIENGIEYIYPLGQYSMAPTLRSNNIVEEKENIVGDELRKEEPKMTRKQLISACVDYQIEKGFVKKENREKQIKIRLNGMGYQKAMRKADCQRWYDALFKENQQQVIDEQDEQEEMLEIKRNSIKNYLKENIENYYMYAKMDYNVDGGFIEANFVNNNNFTETIFIKWYESGYIYTGSIFWDEQDPPKAIYNIWLDGYYTEIEVKEIAEKNTNTQDEPRKEENEMTKKEKITACVDFEIANNEIEKEDRELEINNQLYGNASENPMSDAELETWYNDCFNPKWQQIKNEIKQKINNWFPTHSENQLKKVDGHLEKVRFFFKNEALHIDITWAEQDIFGKKLFNLTYPVNLSLSVDTMLYTWVDYYWKRHLNQNTQNSEIGKDENKMTKKEKIVACVDFEIENGKIKKSDRNFEINSRLNGCKWRPAMNNAELNSWYNDCFNPKYIEIKQELESKINSWFTENKITGLYKDAEFYDNGNGLFIKIVWQQKGNETQVSYSCHFPAKDFTVKAIFASWLEYAPQPQKNELTKIDAPKIENETTETQPSEVGKYFLFPYEFGKYYKFYVSEKKEKILTIENRENGKTLLRDIHNDNIKEEYISLLGIKMFLSELKSDTQNCNIEKQNYTTPTCSSHENQNNDYFIDMFKDIYNEIDYNGCKGRYSPQGLQIAICYLNSLSHKANEQDIAYCTTLAEGKNNICNIKNVTYVNFNNIERGA